MTCGFDVKQLVNGKISYIPHVTDPKKVSLWYEDRQSQWLKKERGVVSTLIDERSRNLK